MRFFKKIKKGFTLVELVVVIAVIAILSAISAITFVTITNNARKSNDITALSTLNKGLIAAEVLYKKPVTMHNALELLDDTAGISDPEKFLKCQNQSFTFAYDLELNRFVLLKDDKISEYSQDKKAQYEAAGLLGNSEIDHKERFWKVVKTIDQAETSEFSAYFSKETVLDRDFTVSVGVDFGVTSYSHTVTYENLSAKPQDVVIRTNGGELVVDDESTGTIKHYGKAGSVNIIECHTASYHEFGTVPFIEIAEGHLVLEAGSEVNGVHVDKEYTVKPTAESEGEKAASTFGNVEISVASGVDMPKFSRDAVSQIADAGTKVCTIDLADEKNNVILFIDGIYEQIKIENTTDGARWVDTSNATQATKTAADQLANNIGGAKGTDYTITGDGETSGTRTIEVVEGHEDVAVVTDSGKDAAEAQVASLLKGDGLSWETAFEIYDYDTMQMITQFASIDYYYFKVNIDKTDNGKIDCRNDWHNVTLFGNFDGSGVVFENLNKGLFGAVGKYNDAAAAKYTYYVKDFTISNCNINSSWGWGVAAYTNGNVTLEDISISGTITGTTSVGSFVEMGYLNGDVLFKNCVSTCNLVCNTAGGFFAHAYQAGNITLDNSYFNGTAYIGNGGGSVNYISGNGNSSTTKQVIFKNMSDTSGYTLPEGILTQENGFTKDSFNCTWTQGINGIKSSKKAGSNAVMTNINNITETFSVGDTISIEALTDTKTAKFIVMIAPNDSTGYGGYLTEYAREMVDVSNGTISSSSVRYCNVTVDKNRAMGYYNNNTVYNVNQNGWGPSYGSAYIEIQEYNSTNTLIRISRIALPAYSAK